MAGISGPINTLPGQSSESPEKECDDCVGALSDEISAKRPDGSKKPWWEHPDLRAEYDRRKAELPRSSIRIQGETDSFGCEYFDLCDNHAKAFHQAEQKYYEEERPCDWCKKPGKLTTARDSDEGSCGPVYEVCVPCLAKQHKALMDELERYQEEYV